MEILKRSDEFLIESCLEQLRVAPYPWLNDSLLKIRLSRDLSLKQMLGIIMALTAIGKYTCGHVQTFVADLDSATREQLLSQLTDKLMVLYPNISICTWFSSNLTYMGSPTFGLAQHLLARGTKECTDYFELSKVVTLPVDLDFYLDVCLQLINTKKASLLHRHIRECQTLKTVSVHEFAKVMFEIIQVRYEPILH